MHLSRRVRIREGKYTLHLKEQSLWRFVRSAGGCDHRKFPILPRKKDHSSFFPPHVPRPRTIEEEEQEKEEEEEEENGEEEEEEDVEGKRRRRRRRRSKERASI
jgi:hypothetical protein